MNEYPDRVFGVLPVFYKPSWDNWGHTKGPIVYLPIDAKPHLIAHEVHHIRQFYASILFSVLTIGLFAVWLHFNRGRMEAAAYAASIGAGLPVGKASEALASPHYGFELTGADAMDLILKRIIDKKLF